MMNKLDYETVEAAVSKKVVGIDEKDKQIIRNAVETFNMHGSIEELREATSRAAFGLIALENVHDARVDLMKAIDEVCTEQSQ